MLSLFQRLCLFGTVICTLLYSGSYAIQQLIIAQNPIMPEPAFSVCDLPCFANITPGETPIEEVPLLMQQHLPGLIRYEIFPDQDGIFYYQDEEQEIKGIISQVNNTVEIITLINLNIPLPQLLKMQNNIFPPVCVIALNSDDDALALFNTGHISLLTVGDITDALYTTDTPIITEITIRRTINSCDATQHIPAWRGFLSTAYYKR